MFDVDALAGYVLAHPWRTACWLVLVSVGWNVGKLFGADVYRWLKLVPGARRRASARDFARKVGH